MKLETLLDDTFKSGLTKLAKASLPLRSAFKLKGIINTLEAELKKYEEVRQAALQKYGKLKEDGSYEVDEAQKVLFKTEEDAKAFFVEHEELAKTEIEVAKLKMAELGDNVVNVTVEELAKLEAILDLN